jgi:hypothetical protein
MCNISAKGTRYARVQTNSKSRSLQNAIWRNPIRELPTSDPIIPWCFPRPLETVLGKPRPNARCHLDFTRRCFTLSWRRTAVISYTVVLPGTGKQWRGHVTSVSSIARDVKMTAIVEGTALLKEHKRPPVTSNNRPSLSKSHINHIPTFYNYCCLETTPIPTH